jgi:hypothetical protein
MGQILIRRIFLLCVLTVGLAGCETTQQQALVLALDKHDEEYCRRQIGPTMPEPDKTYADCRHALMTARATRDVSNTPAFSSVLIGVLVGSAVVAAVINAVWYGLLWLYKAVGRLLRRRPKTHVFYLGDSITRDQYQTLSQDISAFRCLLVRFGTDDYISKTASDEERFEGRQRLKLYKITVAFDNRDRATFKLNLPIHRTLGTQFKCFAEAHSVDQVPAVIEKLTKCDHASDVKQSDSFERTRVYFLLDQFAVVKTINEDVKNNYIYPS